MTAGKTADRTAPARFTAAREWAKRRGLVFAAGAAVLVAAAAVMTDGRFRIFARGQHFTDFYDQLGHSILHGRFDVPRATIGPEAFLIGGRTYGYFGPTPALLRIPLDLVFPWMWGRWTRVVMLGAIAASLAAAHVIHHQVRRALGAPSRSPLAEQAIDASFVLAVGFGTTLAFVARRPILYHEASVVGAAFATGALAALARYLAERRLRQLVSATALALLAVLSRASIGTGPLVALVLLAGATLAGVLLPASGEPGRAHRALERALAFWAVPRGGSARKHALVLVALLAAGGAAIAFRNLRTLGNLSGEPPLDRHVAIMKDPARLARTQGRFIHPENLRTMLYNYLRPDGVVLAGRFPFFLPKPARSALQYDEAHVDSAEPFVSVTAVYPVWLALSLVGIAAAFWPTANKGDRRPELRLALVGAALGCAGPFVAVYLTLRYLHDLFPLFVVAGALGLEALVALAARRVWARVALLAVVLLGAYTCAASVGITLASDRWL